MHRVQRGEVVHVRAVFVLRLLDGNLCCCRGHVDVHLVSWSAARDHHRLSMLAWVGVVLFVVVFALPCRDSLFFKRCAAGTYGPSTAAIACVSCPAGKASAETGRSTCTDCTAGKSTADVGSTSCETCLTGYSSLEGSSGCLICDNNYFDQDADASVALCVECVAEYSGIDCDEVGQEISSLKLRAGFWRVDASSDIILSCKFAAFCVGGTDPDDYCKNGHKGPYCSVCDDSFYKWDGKCFVCRESSWLPLVFGTGLFFFAAVALVLLWRTPAIQSLAEKITHGAALHIKNIAKLTFVTLQILVLMPVVLDLEFPSPFSELLGFLSIVTINLSSLMTGVECYVPSGGSFYFFLAGTTLVPAALCALLAVAGCLVRSKQGVAMYWFIFISFLALPIASVAAFQVFSCEDFDDGSTWLRAVR